MIAPPPPVVTIEDAPRGPIRQSAVVLEGAAPGDHVLVATGRGPAARWPARAGRWRAVAFLEPGENTVTVRAGAATADVKVRWRRWASPYVVRLVWGQASDEPRPTPAQIRKVTLAGRVLEAACAEAMRRAGRGRLAFSVAPGVTVLKLKKTGDELRAPTDAGPQMYDTIGAELPPGDTTKYLAFGGFTRWDGKTVRGHTALGGGRLAVIGTGWLWSWPETLRELPARLTDERPVDDAVDFPDGGGRPYRWATLATTYGAAMHELGHTLGLPHCGDPEEFMSRGFDDADVLVSAFRFTEPARWSPPFAARLAVSPWFGPDGGVRPSAMGPSLRREPDGSVVVTAPYGLRLVGRERDGRDMTWTEFTPTSPTVYTLPPGEGSAYAVDIQGNEARG